MTDRRSMTKQLSTAPQSLPRPAHTPSALLRRPHRGSRMAADPSSCEENQKDGFDPADGQPELGVEQFDKATQPRAKPTTLEELLDLELDVYLGPNAADDGCNQRLSDEMQFADVSLELLVR